MDLRMRCCARIQFICAWFGFVGFLRKLSEIIYTALAHSLPGIFASLELYSSKCSTGAKGRRSEHAIIFDDLGYPFQVSPSPGKVSWSIVMIRNLKKKANCEQDNAWGSFVI